MSKGSIDLSPSLYMDTGYTVVIIYKKIPHLSQKQSSIMKHSWKKNPQKNCCLKYKFVHANTAHKGVGCSSLSTIIYRD